MKMKLELVGALLVITLGLLAGGCDRYNPFTHYMEDHRPQYHFTAASGWVGPPTGMVYFKGKYHVFYQKNDTDTENGIKKWGHAVSRDLVRWEHLSAALDDDEKSFEPGSVVIDWNHTLDMDSTSEPVMVAIYEVHLDGLDTEEIRLAYSRDEGKTWKRHEDNPIIEDGEDLSDPSVYWDDKLQQWIMVAAIEGEEKVQFYTSENLTDWTKQQEFGESGNADRLWRSPGLFALPVDGDVSNKKWILHASVEHPDSGGIGTQYVVGDFDGEQFRSDGNSSENPRWVDHGSDFFAPKRFTNISQNDNRHIWMGWMNNSRYAEDLPTSPWKGALTLPREMMLRTIDGELQLVQQPIVELRELRTNRQRFRKRNLTEESNFLREAGISTASASLVAEFEPNDAKQLGFELRKGSKESTIVAYNAEREELYIDRSSSGNVDFTPSFAERHHAPLKPRDGRIKMRIFLDHSSVVVVGNDGEAVITSQIFPSKESNLMALFVKGETGELVSLDVWRLESIW